MFQAFGNHAKGECLNLRDGLIAVGAVTQDTSQVWDLGQPPAVALALEFDGEVHPGNVASGPAASQPLAAAAVPELCKLSGVPRGSTGQVAQNTWRSVFRLPCRRQEIFAAGQIYTVRLIRSYRSNASAGEGSRE